MDERTEKNIALLLAYDGTAYHGWQIQKNSISVAETLSKAIQKATERPATLHGCGRTDAGVHARRYTANFLSDTRIPPDRLPYAINAVLPSDIAVYEAAIVPRHFHAINSCVRKEYTYHIYQARHPDPFLYRRALFYPYPLDLGAIVRAASDFVGRHDFAAFRTMGTDVKSTIRTVFACDVSHQGRDIYIAIQADGFLYNMARAMVGTLLYVGQGKIPPNGVPELIRQGSRTASGPTAPPHGLYMTGVFYEEKIFRGLDKGKMEIQKVML
jgi:tRNA pseudouridine38-40 synthase